MKRPTIGPITIPFAYTAQFLGRGCRVARSIAIEAELSVMLAHLDDSEAPISFRLTDCGRFDIPAGKSLDIRTALGRHWRPVGSYDGEP